MRPGDRAGGARAGGDAVSLMIGAVTQTHCARRRTCCSGRIRAATRRVRAACRRRVRTRSRHGLNSAGARRVPAQQQLPGSGRSSRCVWCTSCRSSWRASRCIPWGSCTWRRVWGSTSGRVRRTACSLRCTCALRRRSIRESLRGTTCLGVCPSSCTCESVWRASAGVMSSAQTTFALRTSVACRRAGATDGAAGTPTSLTQTESESLRAIAG